MGPFQGQGQQQDSQISPSIYQPQQQPYLICDLYPYPYKNIDSSTTISKTHGTVACFAQQQHLWFI